MTEVARKKELRWVTSHQRVYLYHGGLYKLPLDVFTIQGMSNDRKQATGQEGLLWSRSVQQLGGNTHKVGKGLCSSMNKEGLTAVCESWDRCTTPAPALPVRIEPTPAPWGLTSQCWPTVCLPSPMFPTSHRQWTNSWTSSDAIGSWVTEQQL